MRARAIVCGGDELRATATALGIEIVDHAPQLALVDLRDPSALADAARVPRDLARIVVVAEAQAELCGALGISQSAVATSCEPAVIGPMIAALVTQSRSATRSVLITSVRGGVGRSLLAANLALRLGRSRSVFALDACGAGGLAWWLGVNAAGWDDLEGLSDELTSDHLAVVAAEARPGVRIAGGPPVAPSAMLTRSVLHAALDLADLVLIDAPVLAEQRTRDLMKLVDRVLLVTYDDPISVAALASVALDDHVWLIASQSRATEILGRDVFQSLPRADRDVADAASGNRAIRGALARAYDDLADVLALDAS